MDKALKVLKANGLITVRHACGIFITRLRRPKTGCILFLGHSTDFAKAPIHAEFVSGMRKECASHGLQLIIEHHGGSTSKELKIIENLWCKEQVDGVVLWESTGRQSKTRAFLVEQGIPFVLAPEINNAPSDKYNRVTVNESSQLHDAVNELVSLGHTRIGFVRQTHRGVPHFSGTRIESFKEALVNHGMYPSAVYTLSVDADEMESDLSAKDLKTMRQLTALVCETDQVAGIICRICLREGIRVPGDLSLVSYDNTSLSSILGITTIDPQIGKLGALSVRLLSHEMDGKLTKPECWTAQPKLVMRGSTARPRGA
jgi:DNA-binding LacI/PurR family transcriptional regulator